MMWWKAGAEKRKGKLAHPKKKVLFQPSFSKDHEIMLTFGCVLGVYTYMVSECIDIIWRIAWRTFAAGVSSNRRKRWHGSSWAYEGVEEKNCVSSPVWSLVLCLGGIIILMGKILRISNPTSVMISWGIFTFIVIHSDPLNWCSLKFGEWTETYTPFIRYNIGTMCFWMKGLRNMWGVNLHVRGQHVPGTFRIEEFWPQICVSIYPHSCVASRSLVSRFLLL